METWKDIPGYEGSYQVSNMGRLRSLDRSRTVRNRHGGYMVRHDKGCEIHGSDNGNGYLSVRFYKGGKKQVLYVHRLVAQAFVDHPAGCDTVNHIDHNRSNNAADNLEWVSQGDNVRYSQDRMKHPRKTCRTTSTGEKYITKRGEMYRVQIKSKSIDRKFLVFEDAVSYRNEVIGNA